MATTSDMSNVKETTPYTQQAAAGVKGVAVAADPLDTIARICAEQPHDALTLIAEALSFGQMAPSPVNYLRFHAQNLITQYGSVRKAGDALSIDHTYLYRIAAGEKEWPSDDVLLRMGLERVVTYRKHSPPGVKGGGDAR